MRSPYPMNGPSPRVGLYDGLYAASTFLMANLLWVICSLPLLTMPAATAALFSVLAPWARGKPADSPLMVFFDAMRRHWRASSLLALLDLGLGGLCALNLLILTQAEPAPLVLLSLGLTLLVSALLISVNVYAWPLMVTRELPTRTLLRGALRLALAHPGWALFTALLATLPLAASLFLPLAFLLFTTVAAPALIINWGAWRVIRGEGM